MGITDRAKLGIGFAFQQPVKFKGLTVRDLIELSSGNTINVSEACNYLSDVGLCAKDYLNREVSNSLSGGELKRIEIAMLAAKKSKLTVFDEPEAGIDLWSFNSLISVFEKMHSEISNSSIVIISHQEKILNIADEIILLVDGKVQAVGQKEEVLPLLLKNTQKPCKVMLEKEVTNMSNEIENKLDAIEKNLLKTIADIEKTPIGAYNIRENGKGVARNTTANIDIVTKQDKPGIDIIIKPNTKNESVHIPVILTEAGFNDVVYNDFYVGENADVVIVAGCGIHNSSCETSEHDGIHTFHLSKGAKVKYIEKHYGEGNGTGDRILNPQTIVNLEEGSTLEMETIQIEGVSSTVRETKGELGDNTSLVITERVMTSANQIAKSIFDIDLNGENSSVHVASRAIARDNSVQEFSSNVNGNNKCFGHVECDAIIMDKAKVTSTPKIVANDIDASLLHEAAIGKIAGEQLIKLMTLGLTEKEAEEQIISGFLK